MRLVGLMAATAAVMLLVVPVAAQTADGQAASGGVFDWLVNAVSGSESADQTLDEKKEPAAKDAIENKGAEPQPMEIPEDGISDQESYKPDAGEAPK